MLTAEQLAKVLQVSERTLRRLISSGKIMSPTRIGRQLRWPLVEISKWIEQGCPVPGRLRKGN
ncbi:helix-turn-helix domain-containing protein [Bremerella cremea]